MTKIEAMSAYQKFLDFFSTLNKERLDGLDESYFSDMTQTERARAFQYLLDRLRAVGGEESVNGLFVADPVKEKEPVEALLKANVLTEREKIAAAWNSYRLTGNGELLPIFIEGMQSADSEVREKAAYYAPPDHLTSELKAALQGMIRKETELLPRIHAVNKLLDCYGVSKGCVDKTVWSSIYKGLHSDDQIGKERAFSLLEDIVN